MIYIISLIKNLPTFYGVNLVLLIVILVKWFNVCSHILIITKQINYKKIINNKAIKIA